jgi:hypothetical protein
VFGASRLEWPTLVSSLWAPVDRGDLSAFAGSSQEGQRRRSAAMDQREYRSLRDCFAESDEIVEIAWPFPADEKGACFPDPPPGLSEWR